MGSLFVRIFVGFWAAAVLLIVSVNIATNLLLDDQTAQLRRERQVQIETLAATASEVVGVAEPEQLWRWINQWSQRLGAHLVLLDDTGAPVLASRQRPAGLPRPDAERPRTATAPPPADAPVPAPDAGPRVRPERVEAEFVIADGRTYTLVAMFPPIEGVADPRNRQRLGLLIAILVSGLISFLLARHIARPIRAVREAASALAHGELGARVGDGATTRRDETGQLARDFDHMAERLEALVDDQQRLVRDVSHELRSPLARLQVAMGLARQRGGETIGPELDRMEREAEGLDHIIGELLLLSRLQAEQATERAEVDLLALCEQLAADVAFEGAARGCEVRVSGDATTVRGDLQLLSRAIENISRNALRYSPDGGVVELTVHRTGDAVTINICDQGPGVPEAELGRIFEPFYRVSETREHEGGTGGIGLAIAQRAAAVHGGSISARNRTTGGLCVEITLPR